MTIDDADRRILRELQRDAAQPLDTLGERVGLSRNACWRRIRALEQAGVIRGRVALLDPAALDQGLSVFIHIRAGRHDAEWLARFAAAIWEMPEIQGAYRTSGELDYLLRARVADVAAYDRLYQRLVRRTEPEDISASFVMEELKETTELAL